MTNILAPTVKTLDVLSVLIPTAVTQQFHGVDGYHSTGKNMPGQLHFGKVAFTSCVRDLYSA